MVRRGSGHIVNTAPIAGLMTACGEGSYGATEHAVVGLSKALRVKAKIRGVRVSVLCPGAIRTPILTGGRFGRINFEGVTDAGSSRCGSGAADGSGPVRRAAPARHPRQR